MPSHEYFWVFGYGSLMWNPGFDYLETCRARLYGLHRALCVYSWVHRGTREKPGLVMGLDQGGACVGMAYKVAANQYETVIAYLRAREQVTMVYLERYRKISLLNNHGHQQGTPKMALCYIVNRNHDQYTGNINFSDQLNIVRAARGKSGENPDYIMRTVQRMQELSINDKHLYSIAERLAAE